MTKYTDITQLYIISLHIKIHNPGKVTGFSFAELSKWSMSTVKAVLIHQFITKRSKI